MKELIEEMETEAAQFGERAKMHERGGNPTAASVAYRTRELLLRFTSEVIINEQNRQLQEAQADILAFQNIVAERTHELAKALEIPVERESWWGASTAEKHNVLLARIERLKQNPNNTED